MSICDAAVMEDMPVHVLISYLHRSGALLSVEADEDCHLVSGEEMHWPGCGCRFVPVHPDIQEV